MACMLAQQHTEAGRHVREKPREARLAQPLVPRAPARRTQALCTSTPSCSRSSSSRAGPANSGHSASSRAPAAASELGELSLKLAHHMLRDFGMLLLFNVASASMQAAQGLCSTTLRY